MTKIHDSFDDNKLFHEEMVKGYPKSHRKMNLDIRSYGISDIIFTDEDKGMTSYVSPFGLEFQTQKDLPHGSLLKIHIEIPDYWERKKKIVEYDRTDEPTTFAIIAKVMKVEEQGKRKKKKTFLCQTLNIDEADEFILKEFLKE